MVNSLQTRFFFILILIVSLIAATRAVSAQYGRGPEPLIQTESPVSVSAQDDNASEPSVRSEQAVAISDQRLQKAKRYLEKGEVLFAEKKYDSALEQFTEAYKRLEGSADRYVILYQIGICHERRHRFDSAGQFYRRYLQEADLQARDRESVEKALSELDAKAAQVNRVYAEAKSHVKRGESFYRNKNYNAALAEFEKAYGLLEGYPTRFLVLYNLGKCCQKVFLYDLALTYFRRYLDQAGPEAEDRAEVRAIIDTMQSMLGKLVISTNVKAQVWIDNRKVGYTPGRVLVPGGRYMMELRAQGYESVLTEIQITARESQKHRYRLNKIKEFKDINQAYFYSGVALTAVTLGLGISFGVRAIIKDNQGHRLDRNESPDSIKREIDHLKLAADILYGASGLFAVGTFLLYFFTDFGDQERAENLKTDQQVAILPSVGNRRFNFSIAGRF